MNLSKSKYCKGLQCKKMLWLEKNKPEEAIDKNNESILENGNFIHEIAKYLFGEHVNINYSDNLNEMIKDTQITMESYKDVIITEASFNYDNNFCSVDILKKNNDKYEMYEVKSSTEVKDIFINDISYQYYVLSSLGLDVKKCFIVYINNKYVRNGTLDLNSLFIKEDVTDIIKNMQEDVINNINDINKYMNNENEIKEDIDIKCFKPYECAFFKYCSSHLPENNVFDIANMHLKTKVEYYKKGIYSFEDLSKEKLKDDYNMQIEYELYDKEDYVNKEKIKEFLNSLTMPLYFLDFETFQMPVPLYDGIKPFDKIPFQYSLHYIEDGQLYHKEFLSEAGIDPRRKLAEKLVEDIPINVCVLAYNMGFEKSVIKALANTYEDLSEHLMNIHDNIKDLMIPFKNKEYYNKNFHGSYSIKYVLPALFPNDPDLDYKNLDLIHNGTEAMNSFIDLENKNKEELKKYRESLLKYCKLDTYAMVKIYEKLKEVTK